MNEGGAQTVAKRCVGLGALAAMARKLSADGVGRGASTRARHKSAHRRRRAPDGMMVEMALHWLLLRVRWRRALGPSLVVALLIGGIGGFVLASAIAARRVENTYRTFTDEIDAPDVALVPFVACNVNRTCSSAPSVPDADQMLADVQAMEVVEKARLLESVIPFIVDAAGTPIFGTLDNSNACFGGDQSIPMVSVQPGGPRDQVLPFVLEGELPYPGSGTLVVTRSSAERVGLAIGDSVLLGGWCTTYGDPVKFLNPIELRISGLTIGPLDVEPAGIGLTIHPMFVDPVAFEAMTDDGAELEQVVTAWLNPTASQESVAEALVPYSLEVDFRERRSVFDDALSTDANLLWLLAAVGALGGLLVLAPVIARNMRDTGPNTETLAALGTRRQQITQQARAHCCSLAVVGALLGAIVAVPVSALMPTGLASAFYPNRELRFDGVSIGIGAALIFVVVVLMGAIPAWRIGRVQQPVTSPTSEPSGALALLGLRPAARSGVSAAIGAPVGPRRASPWPSLISMVVAAIVGVASLTYLAGLRHLEQTPRVSGWNWDAIVSFDFRESDPAGSVAAFNAIGELDVVEELTEGTLFPPWILSVPGTDVLAWPWSFDTGPNAIRPVVLSGRAPDGPDEVAVDSLFAAQTGLGLGDTVSLTRQSLIDYMADQFPSRIQNLGLDYELPEVPVQLPLSKEFEITGIALMPSDPAQDLPEVTFSLDGLANLVEPTADEVAIARAWLPDDLPPKLRIDALKFFASLDVRGRVVYLRFVGSVQDGADAVANALANIGTEADIVAPGPEVVLAQVVGLNAESSDRVPVALVIMVAMAFFAIATYLLGASIRSRRFEMAVMRALGLSTSGVRWSVTAQATVTALVSMVIAIPVGVLVGRWAWLRYARDLEVLPVSVIPWSTLAFVAAAAIVIANAVALIPGWFATRRSPGYDLRTE